VIEGGNEGGVRNQQARFVRSAPTRKEFLDDGRAEVAFVGRSNVGKSSLFNCLAGRDDAIVADIDILGSETMREVQP